MVLSEPRSTGMNKSLVIKAWDQIIVIYTSLSPLCHYSFLVVTLVLGLNEQRTTLSPQKTRPISVLYFLDVLFQPVFKFSVWITRKQRLRKATNNESSTKHLAEIWFFALAFSGCSGKYDYAIMFATWETNIKVFS